MMWGQVLTTGLLYSMLVSQPQAMVDRHFKGGSVQSLSDNAEPMLRMLDATQVLMTGGGSFSRSFFGRLRKCMDEFDPQLTKAQDLAWQGIIDYWNSDGSPHDPWGSYPTNYSEYNVTSTIVNGMKIYEPCNFASNIAYYHDVVEFCDCKNSQKSFSFSNAYVSALGKIFSSLAMGSSFMHGSNTYLGRIQDRWTLRAAAYVLHQASLSSLETTSPVLKDLSDTHRPKSSVELVDLFQNIYLNKHVSEWREATVNLDIPEYFISFAGIFSTALTIGFDEETVEFLIPFLADAFKLPDDMKSFLVNKYIPEIRAATQNLTLSLEDRVRFLGNTLGTVSKLVYAFLWQERVLTKDSIFLDPLVNFIGWELLPSVNFIANQFTDFVHFDQMFQAGRGVYPGGYWCNKIIPHAKWHLESGIGLADLAYLTDDMYRILLNA